MSALAPLRPTRRSYTRADTLAALLVFLTLAIAWTWPLATRLSTRLAHDAGDPVLNAWILWWSTQALPFTARWWSPDVFHPLVGALALSEHLFGIALFTAPLHFAGIGPAAAYNLALIATCWFAGFFAFLLGRHLTGSVLGGFVCGVAFAYAPYRAGQLAHLQVMAAHWMPLALLGMHGYLTDHRRRWLALFAGAWLLQALSNGYFLLFFPVLLGAWLLWFGTMREKAAIAATFALSSLLLVPALLRYLEIHTTLGLRRTLGETLMFSASPVSFLQKADLLALWPSSPHPIPEAHLFPGITLSLIVCAGALALVARRRLREAWTARSAPLFYALAALLFWWLCFGPAASGDWSELLSHPYTLLTWLPGFDGLRVPARFAVLATLCLAVAAAIATMRLLPRQPGARRAAGVLLIAGILADGWIEALPLAPVPSRFQLPDVPGATVLELPLEAHDISVQAMYRSISHGRPLVNGYSGHAPPHYHTLATAIRRGDPTALAFVSSGRPVVVVIHRMQDPGSELRAFVERAGGVLHEETGLGPVLVLPPQVLQEVPTLGPVIDAKPTATAPGYAAVDLGGEHEIRALSIDIAGRYDDVATQSHIEVSRDGQTWTTAWQGWTGGYAVAALLADPQRAPMTLPLPSVQARYVRITPAAAWVSEAMRIHRPR